MTHITNNTLLRGIDCRGGFFFIRGERMFVKTVKIKSAAVIIAVLSLVLVCCICAGSVAAVRTAAAKKELPIYSVERGDNKVAISFDAAWGNEQTAALIDILGRYGVKTTFFVVGSWVDKYPESVKALDAAGHEVMNHSNTHPHLTRLDVAGIEKEINLCAAKIESVIGKRPDLLRPPYGDYNDTVIKTIRRLGVYPIQWDVDSLDWKGISAERITERVLGGVKDGSIVLFHNGGEHTAEALPAVIEGLQSKGYEIVPVSQLILRENYMIDHTGRQKPEQYVNSVSES